MAAIVDRSHKPSVLRQVKPLHAIAFGRVSFTAYIGLLALVANIAVAVVLNLAMSSGRATGGAAQASP